MKNIDNTINYIEFPMTDPQSIQTFYTSVFGWQFTEWGPDYLSFSGAQVEGGFNREDGISAQKPGALVILYTSDLEEKLAMIENAGGIVSRAIYSFPGGRRFHFEDPNGNELAIWSEKV